jgi:glutathione S-transferase
MSDSSAPVSASPLTLEQRCAKLRLDMRQLDDLVKRSDLKFELYSIPFSHYNERARWALTHAGIQFTEYKYLPVFHVLPVMLLQRKFGMKGRRDNTSSSPFTTPALAIYDAAGAPILCISDSSMICRFASAYAVHRGGRSLYHVIQKGETASNASIWAEDSDIVSLDQEFHDKLGNATRCVAYAHYLPSFQAFAITDWNSVGWLQALCHIMLYPLIVALLWSGLKLGNKQRLQRHFDTFEEQLGRAAAAKEANHTKYVCRDVITAADITLASLAAVGLAVTPSEGYGAYFPPASLVSNAFAEFTTKTRCTPGGQCVLEAYKRRNDSCTYAAK